MEERRFKFTDRRIANLPLPTDGKRVEYADNETHGLLYDLGVAFFRHVSSSNIEAAARTRKEIVRINRRIMKKASP